ncbi:LPS export ABC transporter periplasmic protein LptC [Limnohabitans sp. Bal53]|uniref:LPS export ABC transporter periplasmic protein LptC n=1 Tax=Limnohabitans sp. Bal53 TaxID=1977910 RepID=UPI000D33D15C|nr:LPS export ABC transporter periplasmic protein LptC [Limnohabitans sp. Bal53]PUE43019.1 LPS export ABC transporter periplasmic protein LptC [Limnohabitans sp. Bal53]
MNMLTRLRRTLDRLTIYLPLFLFAMLALGSWWLVRSVPELILPRIDPQLRQDPDFRLEQFTVKSFDTSGRLTREISGQGATHFPASESLHIEGVRILAENEVGTRLTAQAKKGISREAEQQVILSGDAVAVRQADAQSPRIELRGETLTVWLEEERLVSDQPVRITHGADVFSAQTMNFDTRSGQYELQGRVRAVLPQRQTP